MKPEAKHIKKIWIVGLGLIFAAPLLFMGLISFSSSWLWPDLFPREITLKAWEALGREPRLFSAAWTTMVIGGVVVLLNLVLALPAARALAYYNFRGKTLIETLLMMPILVPGLAVAMGIHLTMLKLGLTDNWLGVALVHLIPTLPYSVRILRAGYERVGRKWEAQAQTLGASPMTIFRTLTLPLLLPSIRSTIFLAFVISLSQYVLTALIGGGNVITLAMIYYPFFSGAEWTVMAAFSMIFALLPIIFLAVSELLLRLACGGWKQAFLTIYTREQR